MKRLLAIIFTFILISPVSIANDPPHPMLRNMNNWCYCFTYGPSESPIGDTYSYRIQSTFEKDGKVYYRMRLDDYAAYGYSSNRREVAEYRHLDIDLREENGRVYVDKEQYMNVMGIKDIPLYSIPGDTSYIPYRETPDGELILYDINMEIGDRFLTVEGHDDIFVIRVDTISFLDDYGRQSDVKRKRIILNNGLFVIEGVGCINSPGGLLCYLNYGSDYWWNYPIGYLYKFNGTGVGIDTLQYNGFYEENPVIIKSQAVRKGMTWQVAVYDNDELSATSKIMETALHEYLDVTKYHHLLSKLDFIIDFVKSLSA